MQLMQNFLLRLNVFPPFNGLMERRLAIYTTLAPVETITSPRCDTRPHRGLVSIL